MNWTVNTLAMHKIVIAGGTGFVGQYLSERFQTLGYQVIIIGRRPGNILWTDPSGISDALENAEMLINLAGKSVNCRYNEKNKAEIFSSRTKTTTILGELIAGCTNPPKLWLNSSTATIYRHAEDRPMTESSGKSEQVFLLMLPNYGKRLFSTSNWKRQDRWHFGWRLFWVRMEVLSFLSKIWFALD